MSVKTKCPATMCPIFAANGSPWTGDKNAPCEMSPKCGWWQEGKCHGEQTSRENIYEVARESGRMPLQMTKTFDCPRAAECQWQQQSVGLCPPRTALAMGIDPRMCA